MRFWIHRNGELPIREQLVNQITLGILSEDLPVGSKLPSVRGLAQRHRIHSNTVSAAYRELVERGWLESRHGSGLYVRAMPTSSDPSGDLDRLVAALLQAGSLLGYQPEDVLQRLERRIRPSTCRRILIAEPDAAMFEILRSEIAEHFAIPVEPVESAGAQFDFAVVVALRSRVSEVRKRLPKDALCLPLRLRSVQAALKDEAHPGTDTVVSIVSRSSEIRHWAHAMLIAVGLDPECLCDVDTSCEGWLERLGAHTLAVCDVVAASRIPSWCRTKVFRVIADSSIEELRHLCGDSDRGNSAKLPD
jgi:DNA-binding transcriptional regulator YhcF (GntR family)